MRFSFLPVSLKSAGFTHNSSQYKRRKFLRNFCLLFPVPWKRARRASWVCPSQQEHPSVLIHASRIEQCRAAFQNFNQCRKTSRPSPTVFSWPVPTLDAPSRVFLHTCVSSASRCDIPVLVNGHDVTNDDATPFNDVTHDASGARASRRITL